MLPHRSAALRGDAMPARGALGPVLGSPPPIGQIKMTASLRDRATCVVTRDGKLLLVADSKSIFMLPGGGVDPGETIEIAAARELLEETGLIATRTTYEYVLETSINRHHVFSVEAEGEVDEAKTASDGEIHGFLWWDLESDLPVYSHVSSVQDWLRAAKETGE